MNVPNPSSAAPPAFDGDEDLYLQPDAHEISASQFKAQCLALLDEVAETSVPLVITKRGKPVAQLLPLAGARRPPSLRGSVRYNTDEDLLAPVDEAWDADS